MENRHELYCDLYEATVGMKHYRQAILAISDQMKVLQTNLAQEERTVNRLGNELATIECPDPVGEVNAVIEKAIAKKEVAL